MPVRDSLKQARRVVVKVGSAVLANGGVLDPACIDRLASDVGAWLDAHEARRAIVVTSGAVASGFRQLGLDRPPKRIAEKQAAAAVGQPRLMSRWGAAFGRQRPPRTTAQVLLTADDIDHRLRFLNARHTLERLLAAGVVPVINENDSVSCSEIKLGDNDRLSALVASLVGADALVILSSVAGLYRSGGAGGAGEVVAEVRSLKDGLKHLSDGREGRTSEVGTGGMATKLTAACEAAALGMTVVIADGSQPGVVRRVLGGEGIGTVFPAVAGGPRARAARERWIGFAARPKGRLHIDSGAARAVLDRGASLLPSGVVTVEGSFGAGALVELIDPRGTSVARGLTPYSSDEVARICGCRASEIESRLGYRYSDEIVHRNDLALIARSTE